MRGSEREDQEIEITSEMIQAGLDYYLSHDEKFYQIEEIIEGVYRAMENQTCQ